MASNGTSSAPPPSTVTDAVLKPSDPVPEDAVPVKGLDFDAFKDRNITVAELVENLKTVGFQATAIGQAVDIVNGMVGDHALQIFRTLLMDISV
jgi:deoxyhypusine synthase